MKRIWWLRHAAKVLLLVVLAVAIVGTVVMLLWNWLMPAVFGLPSIDFWQAAGLFVLGRLLLGGWRGRRGYRGHWHERSRGCAPMSLEERERVRASLRDRDPRGEPPAESMV